MKQEERLLLYINDICMLTGFARGAAYRLCRKIRSKYGLPSKAQIPINHFCDFTGISEESVRRMLFGSQS